MVGLFISETAVPAAGFAAVAAVLRSGPDVAGSLAQLAVNIVGIVVAGVVVLLLVRTSRRRREARSGSGSGSATGEGFAAPGR